MGAERAQGRVARPTSYLLISQTSKRAEGRSRIGRWATTATTKGISWHDLRATAGTWLLAAFEEPKPGPREPAEARRPSRNDVNAMAAPDTRFETTQKYVGEAEAIRDGFGDVFPLPEPLVTAARGRCLRPVSTQPLTTRNVGGADGTRTRGLRRDRPAL